MHILINRLSLSLCKSLICLIVIILMNSIIPYEYSSAYAISPVEWIKVSPTSDGEQWWDKGSLRIMKNGNINILSRLSITEESNSKNTKIFTMEINCKEKVYKDTSINGLPKFNAKWEASNGDELIESVINQACDSTI